ncbi:hypothetical protein [Leptospira levettii]|uniref:hypothetical protein n=1 Tax=Leptospira levettii TaxID=2023178 RepID=UPI000C296A5E|nr:hypothetical protein [Leptospira levettii]PJZ89814.1 hypothetical protein CH368_04420 [Leptospira levettii]
MSLKEIALKANSNYSHQRIFNIESHCISELYWSFLPNSFHTGKVKKCVIEVNQDWGKNLYDYTSLWTDVKKINLNFEFESYLKLDKYNKKKAQLEVLHAGMLKIAENEGWEKKVLIESYNKCLENNLEYQFLVKGQMKTSPDKIHKISLWCNWDLDKIELFWVLFDKKGAEIKRCIFTKKEPQFGEFIYYLSWNWQDNDSIIIENNYKYSKKEKWVISIN